MRAQRERNERLDLRYCSQVMGHLNCYSDLQRRFQALNDDFVNTRSINNASNFKTAKKKKKEMKKRRRRKKKEL